MGAGLRPIPKDVDKPPDPKVRAPVLDPTETGGLAETWVMGVGLRPPGKPVELPPNPRAARAAILSQLEFVDDLPILTDHPIQWQLPGDPHCSPDVVLSVITVEVGLHFS